MTGECHLTDAIGIEWKEPGDTSSRRTSKSAPFIWPQSSGADR